MQKQSASNNTKGKQDESKNVREEPPKMQHYDDDYCLGMWSQPDIMDMSYLTSEVDRTKIRRQMKLNFTLVKSQLEKVKREKKRQRQLILETGQPG
jgi:hypothetical protein